jgi:hypothetical protein
LAFAVLSLFAAGAWANEDIERDSSEPKKLLIPSYYGVGEILIIKESIELDDNDWKQLRELPKPYRLKLNETTTAIPGGAFSADATQPECVIIAITAPKVTEVGKGAFNGCKLLTAAELPDAVDLENDVFKNCTALKKVVLSDDILPKIEEKIEEKIAGAGGESGEESAPAAEENNEEDPWNIFGLEKIADDTTEKFSWEGDFSPDGDVTLCFFKLETVLAFKGGNGLINRIPNAGGKYSPVRLPDDIEFCTVSPATTVKYVRGNLEELVKKYLQEEEGQEVDLENIVIAGERTLFLQSGDHDRLDTIIQWVSNNNDVIEVRVPTDSKGSKALGGFKPKSGPEVYVAVVTPGEKDEVVTLTAFICKFDPLDPTNFASDNTYSLEITVKGKGTGDTDTGEGDPKNPDKPGNQGNPGNPGGDVPGVAVSGVSLNLSSAELAIGGRPLALTATVTPAGAAAMTWVSSNPNIARVRSSSGSANTVEAVSGGAAVIVVAAGGKTAFCVVTVSSEEGNAVDAITLDSSGANLERGKTLTLTAAVTPAGTADVKVRWDSSEPAVAAIEDHGDGSATVTAGEDGFAVITATAGGKTASCAIKVGIDSTTTIVERGGGGGGCNGAGVWSLAALAAPFALSRRRK